MESTHSINLPHLSLYQLHPQLNPVLLVLLVRLDAITNDRLHVPLVRGVSGVGLPQVGQASHLFQPKPSDLAPPPIQPRRPLFDSS